MGSSALLTSSGNFFNGPVQEVLANKVPNL